MEDKQIEALLSEIRKLYRERVGDLFDELFALIKPQTHLFKKTTYKVELTFQEWIALKDHYLSGLENATKSN